MTRQGWLVLVFVLSLIAASAAYLDRQQSRRALGRPGLVITNESIFVHDGTSTNPPALWSTNQVFLPGRVLDYESAMGTVRPIAASVLPKDTVFGHRTYGNSNRVIDCQVILMGADRTSIHKPEGCLQGTGFETISSEKATVPIERPYRYDLPVRRLKIRRNIRDEDGNLHMQSGVFVYWFVTDGKVTSEHVDRMWSMARGLLTTGVLERWGYIICYSPCEPGREEETFDDLKDFIAASVPEFHLTVRPAADGDRAGVR
jgi:hypothetical protein